MVFDVKAYGARGDGGTKDTQAIQAAVEDCSAGGWYIFRPVCISAERLSFWTTSPCIWIRERSSKHRAIWRIIRI